MHKFDSPKGFLQFSLGPRQRGPAQPDHLLLEDLRAPRVEPPKEGFDGVAQVGKRGAVLADRGVALPHLRLRIGGADPLRSLRDLLATIPNQEIHPIT